MRKTSLLALTIAAACADGRGSASRVQVDTMGGIMHVRTSGAALEWRLEPLFTLGSAGEGSEGFGAVVSILADSAGNAYVADRNAAEIRVFDSTGAHVRTIGRRGRGPGEIQDLYSIAWLSGALAVLDPGNGRLGLFERDGRWSGSRPVQLVTGPAVALVRAGEDEIYALGARPANGGLRGTFVRHTRAAPGDTLDRPPRDPRAEQHGVTCMGWDVIHFFAVDFGPTSFATVAPGGVLVSAWTETYRIVFWGRTGDTVRVVERERSLIPVADAEWDAQLAEFRRLRERWTGAQCKPSEPRRPAAKPALRHIFFDHRGRMWVEAYDAAGFVFEVFDGEGRLVGAVPVPSRDESVEPYVRGERLYYVITDSLGVQYVQASRIVERR